MSNMVVGVEVRDTAYAIHTRRPLGDHLEISLDMLEHFGADDRVELSRIAFPRSRIADKEPCRLAEARRSALHCDRTEIESSIDDLRAAVFQKVRQATGPASNLQDGANLLSLEDPLHPL